MAVKRTLAAQGCHHCRSAALKFLTGPSPLSPGPFARNTAPLISQSRSVVPTFTRSFSSSTKDTIPLIDQEQSEHNLEYKSSDRNREGESTASEVAGIVDVPWYLQVEPPRHVASIEPPPLPEIPPDSPPVIGSLLEYASEELGLNELSLLDLRKLDPSPALGPNLFMLFGTVRSERHLHVSAGRLVRWLRYEHRIQADADGLLGPNERKKKLRRKAKRAKLLGTLGTDDRDDGISTGWICVNLGTVGRGGGESTIVGEDGRVAGFGIAQGGSTIVVQIMTESRRAQLDLETLWKNALDRPTAEEEESRQSRQSRQPHTERSKPRERQADLHPLEKAMLSHAPTRPVARHGRDKDAPFGQASFYSTVAGSGVKDTNDPLRVDSIEKVSHLLTYDAGQKVRVLELLRARLNELDPLRVRRALGSTENGGNYSQAMTPFLQLFKLACKHLPESRTWEYRLAMQAKARESGLHDAPRLDDDVRNLVREMRVSGIQASREQYLQLLACICNASNARIPRDQQSELILALLQTMYQRGQRILANDIIATIIEGRSPPPNWHRPDHERVQRLRQLAVQARLPCPDEPTLMRLMEAYARRGHWEAVWDTWRLPPRHLRARSRHMYLLLLRLAASTQNPLICTQVARQCFQEMIAEDPPVRLAGEVRDALVNCIRLADPQAKLYADTIPADAKGFGAKLANREFVKLIRVIQNMR